jgi:hypothetical protein
MAQARGVRVAGSYAFVVGVNGLTVVDVSVPTAPAVAASHPLPDPNQLDLAGNRVYVATGSSRGLAVVDVSIPLAPIATDTIDMLGPINAYDVAVAGPFALVTDTGGTVSVVDASDPSNLVLVGTTGVVPELLGARYLAASSDLVYVTSQDNDSLTVLRLDASTIHLDENGAAVIGVAWTGTRADATSTGSVCDSWSGTSDIATMGLVGCAHEAWTLSPPRPCTGAAHLYCLEQ